MQEAGSVNLGCRLDAWRYYFHGSICCSCRAHKHLCSFPEQDGRSGSWPPHWTGYSWATGVPSAGAASTPPGDPEFSATALLLLWLTGGFFAPLFPFGLIALSCTCAGCKPMSLGEKGHRDLSSELPGGSGTGGLVGTRVFPVQPLSAKTQGWPGTSGLMWGPEEPSRGLRKTESRLPTGPGRGCRVRPCPLLQRKERLWAPPAGPPPRALLPLAGCRVLVPGAGHPAQGLGPEGVVLSIGTSAPVPVPRKSPLESGSSLI